MYLFTGYTLKEIGLPNIAETQPSDCCEDREFETEYAQTNEPKLNEMQRHIFDIVLRNVNEIQAGFTSQCRVYFVDGPGGSGKTMLYNTLICALLAHGHKVHSL